jgi:Ion channel
MTSQILVGGTTLGSILVGGATSLVNLIIHAVLLAGVSRTVRRLSVSDRAVPEVLQYTIVIVATGTLLVMGHFAEVVVWAHTYELVGAAPPGTDLVYFAFGNYTTLGYGDVLPLPQWRVLGPMTALNGIMLIGWSTALIIEILRRSGRAAGQVLAAQASNSDASS